MAVDLWLPEAPQFLDGNGDPLSGALLFFYLAGTSTKENTFTDSSGGTPNSNPMVTNADGRLAQAVWLTSGIAYKVGLANPGQSDPPSAFIPPWPIDNVTGMSGGGGAGSTGEWILGPTPTYVSATSFTLVGDQTSDFTVGRRVQIVDSGGTKYATIKTSAFTTLTTITLDTQDSDALAGPLSSASYGLLNPAHTSHPVYTDTLPLAGDSADRSKRFRLELSGITTGTTRVGTPPNEDFTFVGVDTVQTLTNKTLTSPTVTTPTLNGNISGSSISSQADLEAASSTMLIVTPGRLHFHPSAAKAWVKWNNAGTIAASYNVTSMTDNGTGNFTITIATDFSSANYVGVAMVFDTGVTQVAHEASQFAGTFQIIVRGADNLVKDSEPYFCVMFGDQ